MNILVTGANGFVASNIIKSFELNTSHKIFKITRQSLNLYSQTDVKTFVDENSIDTDLYDRVYALSAYHPNWGWGLVLPKSGWTASDIPKYYDFYEYIEGFDNTQNEGVINWSDSFTKVDEDITKVNWNIVRQDLITLSLIHI